MDSAWRRTHQLVVRLVEALDHEQFLDECLDAVVDQLGADRGMVLLVDGDRMTYPVNARGANRSLSRIEREEVSRTIIDEAIREDACVSWNVLDADGATDSVLHLGISAALAAPLRTRSWRGSRQPLPCGAVYVDFRDREIVLDDAARGYFDAITALVSAALDQSQRMQSLREDLRERRVTEHPVSGMPSLDDLLRSAALSDLRAEVQACLESSAPLIVLGESGSGKTMLAHAIARATGREPVVRAVLGSSADLNTITSELFGHERGAFSGAVARRRGLVEHAAGGTLILDEVLNLPLAAQQLLLDFTQFGTYRPLGHADPEPKHADVRIISVTNGDLRAAVREGRFREDLYYRLAGTVVTVPPLRERREDAVELARGVLSRLDPDREWRLSVPLRRLLASSDLDWPGNIRQLEQMVRRMRDRALARDPVARTVGLEHLGVGDTQPPPTPETPPGRDALSVDDANLLSAWNELKDRRGALDAREADIIARALRKHGGVLTYAAEELGVARTTLASRVDALGVARPRRPRRRD